MEDQNNCLVGRLASQYRQQWFLKLAIEAYSIYREKSNFEDSYKQPIPSWDKLPEMMKYAWLAATQNTARQIFDKD